MGVLALAGAAGVYKVCGEVLWCRRERDAHLVLGANKSSTG